MTKHNLSKPVGFLCLLCVIDYKLNFLFPDAILYQQQQEQQTEIETEFSHNDSINYQNIFLKPNNKYNKPMTSTQRSQGEKKFIYITKQNRLPLQTQINETKKQSSQSHLQPALVRNSSLTGEKENIGETSVSKCCKHCKENTILLQNVLKELKYLRREYNGSEFV